MPFRLSSCCVIMEGSRRLQNHGRGAAGLAALRIAAGRVVALKAEAGVEVAVVAVQRVLPLEERALGE